jgi:hypothetical protein
MDEAKARASPLARHAHLRSTWMRDMARHLPLLRSMVFFYPSIPYASIIIASNLTVDTGS